VKNPLPVFVAVPYINSAIVTPYYLVILYLIVFIIN